MIPKAWHRLVNLFPRASTHRRRARATSGPRLRLEAIEPRLLPSTVFWTNPTGGDWSTPGNWSSGQLPGATDDVVIDVPGNVTVTHSARADTIHSLTARNSLAVTGGSLGLVTASVIHNTLSLGGGILVGPGDLTVDDVLTWTGGILAGAGRTLARGGLFLGGSATKMLIVHTLTNAGTAVWSGTGDLVGSTNAVVENLAGATFDVLGGVSFRTTSAATWNNTGTFQKVDGTVTTIDAQFNNAGTVDVQAGTLNLTGGGQSGGTFAAADGATLGFAGGTHTLSSTSTIRGAGTVIFGGADSAVATVLGTYDLSGPTAVNGGTVNFMRDVTLSTLTLSGGTLAGFGDVTVAGLLSWTGGGMSGLGRTLAEGGLAISGTTPKFLDSRTLVNEATATWQGGNISARNAAVWDNQPGALFDVQTDAGFVSVIGAPRFDNAGTVRKSAGTGTAILGPIFNNNGSLDVQTGTLSLSGDGLSRGVFTSERGATLNFSGGMQTLSSTSSVAGAGDVTFSGRGTMNVAGVYNIGGTTTVGGGVVNFSSVMITIGNSLVVAIGRANFISPISITLPVLNMRSGELTGTSDVLVTGMFTWAGGALRGTGRLTAAGGLAIASGGGFLDGRTLDNLGSATWTGDSIIGVANGGYFNNHAGATLTIQSDVSMQQYGGPGGLLNAGTVRKVNGSGSTSLVLVDNSGTVDVQTGTVHLRGNGGTSSGNITLATGTTIDIAEGNIFTFTATSQITGAGSVIFTSFLGTTNVAGVFTAGGGTTVASGTVNFTGNMTSLGSSLTVRSGVANFSGPSSVTVPRLTLLESGTLAGTSDVVITGQTTWSAGTMTGSGHTRALGGMVIGSDPTFGKLLDGRTVDSGGTTTWTGSTDIFIRNSMVWNNLAQATFDVQADVSFSLVSGQGSASSFNNLGTFLKSAGSRATTIPIAFNNSGSVRVRSGRLTLSGGGFDSGVFLIDQGAGLAFEGGTHTLSSTAVVQGAGGVSFSVPLTVVNVAGHYDIGGGTGVGAGTVNFTGPAIGLGSSLLLSGGTVNLSSPDAVNVPSLILSGGILTGTSDILVAGPSAWSGGVMQGTGRTIANGALAISGSSVKELSRPLENRAAATWAGTGAIRSSARATWTNLPAASLIIQNDADFDGTLENQGTIRKQGSTGRTNFSWIFESSGAVDVESGTLSVGYGGTSSGPFTVAAGATLEIGGEGVHTLTPASRITGAGNVIFSDNFGGVINVSGLYDIGGTTVIGAANSNYGTIHFTNPVIHLGSALTINIGTVDFSGPVVVTVPTLTLSDIFHYDSTLTGTSDIVVTGLLTWTGGSMSGSGHTVAEGGISISGSTAKKLNGRTLDNFGTATWTGAGDINVGNGAVWSNFAGAIFDVQTDASLSVFFIGAGDQPPVFNNTGLFQKSAGTGRTGIQAQLNNRGAVDVQTGTVSLSLPGSDSTGSFTVQEGATLEFDAGTHVLRASSSITGAGTVRFGNDLFGRNTTTILGTYNISGTTQISSGTVTFVNDAALSSLALSGGTLASFGDLTVMGSFTWTGGTISGPGRTIAGGDLSISGANVLDGAILNNTGTATWSGTGAISLINGAVLNNQEGATFTVTGSSLSLTASAGVPAAFHNAGTLIESAPGGTLTIQVVFDNTGTMDVAGGTLRLTGPFLNYSEAAGELAGGTYVVGGTFQFPNAHIIRNAAGIVLDGTNAQIIDQFGPDALANIATNTANGSLTIQNGRNLTVGAFSNLGQVTVGPGSQLVTNGTYLQTDGATVLIDGDLAALTGLDLEGGTLSGAGSIDADVTNSGLVHPGGDGATGTLRINGNYTQTAAGVLHMDLGGLMPGLGYDQLLINGAAALDGELDVGEIDGFVPQAGDSFRILAFAARTGDFTTTSGLDLGGGLVLDLVYDANGLTLQTRQSPHHRRGRAGAQVAWPENEIAAALGPRRNDKPG